ncbi:unnamed protein product [Amoebophrya sp. A120]|nr:unnamed protein product [Amoebophrya sp. A120]|eukprot:GSA120T00002250001.1
MGCLCCCCKGKIPNSWEEQIEVKRPLVPLPDDAKKAILRVRFPDAVEIFRIVDAGTSAPPGDGGTTSVDMDLTPATDADKQAAAGGGAKGEQYQLQKTSMLQSKLITMGISGSSENSPNSSSHLEGQTFVPGIGDVAGSELPAALIASLGLMPKPPQLRDHQHVVANSSLSLFLTTADKQHGWTVASMSSASSTAVVLDDANLATDLRRKKVLDPKGEKFKIRRILYREETYVLNNQFAGETYAI